MKIAAHPETMDQAAEDAYASSIRLTWKSKNKSIWQRGGRDFMTFDPVLQLQFVHQ